MFPVLTVMYVRLAKREESEAISTFGDAYIKYMNEVPGFIPRFSRFFGQPNRRELPS
jgi:protein-S-isoprenylcysteine O-methyltransferase Ste14